MKITLTILLIVAAVLCHAQDTTSVESANDQVESANPDFKYRNPAAAFGLSLLISGAGQFYNGQNTKGAVMLGSSALGVGLWVNGVKNSNPDTGIPGFFMMIGVGLWSIVDAPIVANRLNKENNLSWNIQPSFRPISNGVATNTASGLQLTFRF